MTMRIFSIIPLMLLAEAAICQSAPAPERASAELIVCVQDTATAVIEPSPDPLAHVAPAGGPATDAAFHMLDSERRYIGIASPLRGFSPDTTCLPAQLGPSYVRALGSC